MIRRVSGNVENTKPTVKYLDVAAYEQDVCENNPIYEQFDIKF